MTRVRKKVVKKRGRSKLERPKDLDDVSYIDPDLRPLAVAIGGLAYDHENVRLHSEVNIKAAEESLGRYGQKKPIVVQKSSNKIVAGNCTVIAAKRLGWVYVAANVTEMSDEEAAGYGIADNRTAELAEWDYPNIGVLVEKYSLDSSYAIGFNTDELSSIMQSRAWGEQDEEKAASSKEKDTDADVAVTIKVRVFDAPNREKVQAAIAQLIEESDLKELCKVQGS